MASQPLLVSAPNPTVTGMRRRTLAILAATGAVVTACSALLSETVQTAARNRVSLVSEGPPLPLSAGALVRQASLRRSVNNAQLISMAEDAVGRLMKRIAAEERRQSPSRPEVYGTSGFKVATTPQLAAYADDVVVGGRHFVKSQMLSAIDTFFDSDANKLLVAQAIEEEALEAENGGQGEGTEVMAADALERLEAGDSEFENEWANAGEKVVADSSANRATHATYKYMIERDLGHSREEFNVAKDEADAESIKLQQQQAALNIADQSLAAAQQAAVHAETAVTAADEDIAAAEAAQAALDAQAESDAELAASCPELAAALATAGTAGQHFTDALEIVVDATGDSSTTVSDVAAIGTAAEDVSATEGTVASARASCLAQMGQPSDDTAPAVPSALSIEQATAAKATAQAAKEAADAAVTEKEAQKAAAEAAVAEQQALYDEKKAIQDAKQAIMDKLLEAHKALACDSNKLATVEPYTIEMEEAGACEFPADASRVQFAISQAERAAEEARNRAEIEGLMSSKAWWQTALDELGDAKPAIDNAKAAWNAAIAMKDAEAAA